MKAMAFLLLVVATGALGQVVAVAPAVDRSGSGLLNLEFGLAEILEGKLREAGYTVIPARALESWRLGQGIVVREEETWRAAAESLGATHLVLLFLDRLTTARLSLALGLVYLEAVNAESTVSAKVLDLVGQKAPAEASASGTGQGQLVPSFRLFLSIPWDVCLGGLRTNKSTYLQGEPVLIGYVDPTPPRSFYVVVRSGATPTLFWTSSVLSSTVGDPCVRWTWDQTFGGVAAPPGPYQVEVYEASTSSLLSIARFTIEPGFPAWGLELRFGAPEFWGTPWQQALTLAMENLWERLRPLLPHPARLQG